MTNELITNVNDNADAWQSVFYCLLESSESGEWVNVTDAVSVKMRPWECGELYDSEHEKLFTSRYVMCCEDDEEFTAEAASQLLHDYAGFINAIPDPVQCIEDARCWAQAKPFYDAVMDASLVIRHVFDNCYWGLYYGDYGFETLMENDWNYGLPRELALEIWRIAFWYCAEGCMEDAA